RLRRRRCRRRPIRSPCARRPGRPGRRGGRPRNRSLLLLLVLPYLRRRCLPRPRPPAMTSSNAARLVLAFGSFVALSAPATALAQRTAQDIESARQLYNQGIELRDKGDLRGALDKLRAAHALGNTPITGIELCRTYAALRQPVEAREVCLG